jgi:periplasmic protein TonB
MIPAQPTPTRRLQTSWTTHLGGVAAGLAFTGLIAAGLAYFSKTPPAQEEEPIVEVRAVEIPEPPPPPPQKAHEGTPLPPAPMIFDEAPSTSVVRIAPTPIPIAPLVSEIRPTFSLQFDFSPGQFRPGGGDWEPDVDHVFQRSEVDQQVVAIFKKVPSIPTSLLKEVKNTRVRVLLVVNTDGSAENVRLIKGSHPEFDRLVVEALREWRFRPAVRKGKKVRCLAEVPVYVKPPNRDPFSTS